jgi:chromosome segregation ATPase
LTTEVNNLKNNLESEILRFETELSTLKDKYELELTNSRSQLSRTARKAEEFKGELDILMHKMEVLTGEISNSKKLIEKKDSLIESLKQNNDQENDELKAQLKELKAQLKTKNAELQVGKAKYDRDLTVLNEKAK